MFSNGVFTSLLLQDDYIVPDVGMVLICAACSLILGLLIAWFYMFRNSYTKGFALTLVLLPVIVQIVISVVNGNVGTGIAVAGAFGLVRFRSAPGSARDIASVFLAMAVGLATGSGYVALAATLTVIVIGVGVLLTCLDFGARRHGERDLRITIPESLDYSEVFEDIFAKYTSKHELEKVKTSNMGSLYKLQYRITLKDISKEKQMIDEIRCRNGNLEIVCGVTDMAKVEQL